jgi:hypothetical protein
MRSAIRGFNCSRIEMCAEACAVLDQMQDLEEIERRLLSVRRRVDEDIEIAVRTRITACPRSEQSELFDAFGFQGRCQFAQPAEKRFKRNVGNVIHRSDGSMNALTRTGQQRLDQRTHRGLVVGPPALDQRDRARQRGVVA